MSSRSRLDGPATGSPVFEVERFGFAAPGRIEVIGRWFGVRGRRFMRPTLDLRGAGEQRRLLAVLDHKPWAAEDGERWMAAFAWEADGGFSSAELAVAPGIEVQLGAPEGPVTGGTPRRFARVEPVRPAAEEVARAPLVTTDALVRERDAALRERDAAVRELQALRSEAEGQAYQARERLERERDAAVSELRAREAAEERIAALEEELAGRHRPEAAQDATPVEALRRERDAALAERDAAVRAREAAESERDRAVNARDAAERQRRAIADRRERRAGGREPVDVWLPRVLAFGALSSMVLLFLILVRAIV